MIIRKVKLTNFGIYAGKQEFDLKPVPAGNFERPIVLFRGKNGVGKTTFVEAMRLCLHGSLTLGSRVGQREFDDYLRRHIHHHTNGAVQPTEANVEIVFEYVTLGKKATYRVLRRWEQQGHRLVKELFIWEDENLLSNMDNDQNEQFLRELVPPGVVNLFFFDGEKIQTLAEDSETSGVLLADTIKSLLGLDLVDQLGKDLDVYVSRQESHSSVAHLQAELSHLNTEQDELEPQIASIQLKQQDIATQIIETLNTITTQEQKIASEGGKFAARREKSMARQQRLMIDIETHRRQIQELCAGLMPFAITPKMLKAVVARLQVEEEYEQIQAAQRVITDGLRELQNELVKDEYWFELGLNPGLPTRHALFNKIAADLYHQISETTVSPDNVILHVSDKERETLSSWISQALEEVPQRFSKVVGELATLERELAHVNDQLGRTPANETLQPLLAGLNQLHRQLGALEQGQVILAQQLHHLSFRLEQIGWKKQRVRGQITEQESGTSRIYRAAKARTLLEAYKKRVTKQKVAQLETLLVKRFTQLCRKEGFLDKVCINPETFQVALYCLGKEFSRQQLSAGEKQLFAIATLWALREVSGRPIPVIIDTPLSRLDSEHRINMAQEFFAHVSHQVIMMATDAEVDDALHRRLEPAISHTFEMQYDPGIGAMTYEQKSSYVNPQPLIRLERISVS